MPSVSKKQHNLMAMVANDPKAAKRLGIPQSVGEEYVKADKGKAFKGTERVRPDLQHVNRPKTRQGKNELFKEGGMATKQKFPMGQKMGAVKTAAPSRDGVAIKGKTKGRNLGNSGKTVGIQSGAKGMKRGGKC